MENKKLLIVCIIIVALFAFGLLLSFLLPIILGGVFLD